MSKKLKLLLVILLAVSLVFLYGISIYPHAAAVPSGMSLEPPSIAHWLGTDNLGLDIFAQISMGFFNSMFIGILAAGVSFFIGGILGILSGFLGGKIDHLVLLMINVFLSIPQLPIMIVAGVFFGQSVWNVIIIISIFSWAPIAKVVREKTLNICGREYIRLAVSYGGTPFYIVKRHLLREILPLLTVNAMGVISKGIVQEASLAFLGLSDPLSKSWGLMINKAINFKGIYFTEYWKWWLIPPIVCLMAVIFLIRLLPKELEKEWLE